MSNRTIFEPGPEVHLRDQSVLPTGDLIVNVGGTHQIRPRRIGGGLDRLESIPALRVGGQRGGPFKIRIERRRVRVARMCIASMGIGLPDLDLGIMNRIAGNTQHAAHDVEDLAFRATRSTRNPCEIAGRRQGLERVERA